MTKIRFYLKNQHINKETSIFMLVHCGCFQVKNGQKKYLPLKYYIGESIRPSHWNKRTNRARELKEYPQYAFLNRRLTQLENTVQCLLLELKNINKILIINELKEMLDEWFKNQAKCKTIKKTVDLFQFIELFIQESRTSKAASTILQYKNTLRLLMEYANNVQKIDFKNIDLTFYHSFKKHMNDAGYSAAYFSNQIKFIKLFMNEATERGYNTQTYFKSKKFTSIPLSSHKIYLTKEEILYIQAVDLSDKKNWAQSRDMFVIACKTGLRFSDLVRLTAANFSHNILCIQTKKTGILVYIPLSPDVWTLCEKYAFRLPAISNATFNQHIREVAKRANLITPIAITMVKNAVKTQITVPKYQLVTAHTARRSFVTNAFLERVPTLSIMKITGHTTEQSFMQYIRISAEDNAKQLLSHPHFS